LQERLYVYPLEVRKLPGIVVHRFPCAIEMSYGAAFPKELARLINTLIDNHQIKDMIMKRNSGLLAKEDTMVYIF
jgi:hypothetical protein